MEFAFRSKVEQALKEVQKILDLNRHPAFAPDVQHQYDDKYLLVNLLVNTAIAAQLNALECLGLTGEHLARLLSWAGARAVTLRFHADERCAFLRAAERKEDSPTQHVTKTSFLGITATSSSKVVSTVKEWFWRLDADLHVTAFSGPSPSGDNALVLSSVASSVELKTLSEQPPFPPAAAPAPLDLDVTWLLQCLTPGHLRLRFSVDRAADACRTPRRNPQVEAALSFFARAAAWASAVERYLGQSLFPKQQPAPSQSSINTSGLFVPVLPLFESRTAQQRGAGRAAQSSHGSSGLYSFVGLDLNSQIHPSSSSSSSSSSSTETTSSNTQASSSSSSSLLLSIDDLNAFLSHQRDALRRRQSELSPLYQPPTALANPSSAFLRVVALHLLDVAQHLADSVSLVEQMLMRQLTAAIGKVVSSADFAAYMRFHYRKLFPPALLPRPFSFAVRRPDHSPEGLVSIEGQVHDGSMPQPALTSVRALPPSHAHPMRFSLDAATRVTFRGERFLHSWIDHSFSGSSGQSLSLVARARQFSCFILLLGRVVSVEVFEPSCAIVLQNKDELTIPLLLEQIPTPKEFRDAIESLSPEQQRFARAYRAMQLEGTLFAVCVIQIKPQLERLLKLPADALTKEIRLTQDLMDLFVTYQIPSDLLSYDGPESAPAPAKVQRVKALVARIKEMIAEKKQAEKNDALLGQVYDDLGHFSPHPPPPPPPDPFEPCSFLGGAAPSGSAGPPPPPPPGGAAPSWNSPPPPRQFPAMPAPPVFLPTSSRSSSSSSSALPTPASNASSPSNAGSKAAVPKAETQKPATPSSKETTAESAQSQVLFDATRLPAKLDRAFDKLDLDAALRPTIIKAGKSWTKRSQASLLADPSTSTIAGAERKAEKNKAFDLLDALSCSGALHFDDVSFHIILAATHVFTKSVVDTVIQDNVNPIEKVERSLLIVASTLQEKPVEEFVKADQLARVQLASPHLFS